MPISSTASTIPAVHSPSAWVRVVVADDHPFYRAGLTRQLGANGIEVVAEVPNATAVLVAVDEYAPDVVVMDLNMPGVRAVEAIRLLDQQIPCPRVVVLTVSSESPDMTEAMLAGAAGYVLKDDLPEHIVDAVRGAAAGESAISPRAASALLMRARSRGGRAGLAGHELGVLELLAEGRPAREIVDTLMGSRRSLREQLVSILLKLAVDDPRVGHPA